ncbi:pilin [Streptomyces sp. NPDC050516]|uniref:pilin n=1 Tax=Streptomyces sp. NPDC050516 TaxID=3365621 RepID=UPI003799E049
MLVPLRPLRAKARRLVRGRPGRAFARILCLTVSVCAVLFAGAPRSWAVADVPTVISNLRNWIVGLLAGLATLFLTFGGLRYLMAGGDPGEVEAAKRALKAAAIGYGLAILAPVLVTALQGIVGAGT